VGAKDDLLKLILEVSFEKRRVTLASGKESDFYLDLRQTLMRPRGARLAGLLALEKLLGGPPVEAVGGMAVGAVPFVSAILLAAAERDPETELLGFFVRKEAKKHGLGRRIEGGSRPVRASPWSRTPPPPAARPWTPSTPSRSRAERSRGCSAWWTGVRARGRPSPSAASSWRRSTRAPTCPCRSRVE
jgi:hypothetical protein